MTYKMLIVDDELANLRLLERLFSRQFECLTASSGAEAIRLLEHHDVAILITDQRMPQMTGIDLLKYTARLRPHMVRILLTGYSDVEVLVDAINSGLVYMYVTKPWNNDDLKLKINRACEHYESNKNGNTLALVNERLLGRLKETRLNVVASLGEMLRTRNEYAFEHALRVRDYAIAIAEKMSMSEDDREELSAAAMLSHLSDADVFSNTMSGRRWSAHNNTTGVRAHSECEARLLASIPDLGKAVDLIKFQQENFDGTGSPGGLAGEQIPLASRILRVANEYYSMIQPQETLASMRHDEAMRFLSQRSGKQFDPHVILNVSQLAPLDVPDSAIIATDAAFETDDFAPAFVESVV